jgi:G3E family GTPase
MSLETVTPVTVLTGFLGSGKTTVLNHLLRQPHLKDTVVIINEFGEVGLDHLLIERTDENLLLLENGCVCCTVRGDLVETLSRLIAQRGEGLLPTFPRVVMETTGLADPAPILHTLMVDAELTKHYRLKGVVATVDCVNGSQTLNAYTEAVRQAAMADRILLTKADLAAAGAVAAIKTRLRTLNPGAAIIDVQDGQVEPDNFFSVAAYEPGAKTVDVQQWLRAAASSESPVHSHDDDHDHHSTHGDEHIRSHCFTIDIPVRWDAFSHWLELMAAMRGEQMLRVKGLVAIAEQPDRPMVVHGVQSVFHPPKQLDAWPSADRRTRLIFITRDIPRELIERTLIKFAQVAPPSIAVA